MKALIALRVEQAVADLLSELIDPGEHAHYQGGVSPADVRVPAKQGAIVIHRRSAGIYPVTEPKSATLPSILGRRHDVAPLHIALGINARGPRFVGVDTGDDISAFLGLYQRGRGVKTAPSYKDFPCHFT